MVTVKIKPLVEGLKPIVAAHPGEWIDLRSAEDISLEVGEYHCVRLGVAIELPPGYEAHIASRSSTFKKWAIMPANGIGIVDNAYKGNDDEWMFPVIAYRLTKIHKHDRICQFRIVESMDAVKIETVKHLGNENRGGFGSTGGA